MLKLLVTLQISWLAMLGPMGSAVVNPAFVTMGKVFKMTPVEISYGENAPQQTRHDVRKDVR
jgi:hypothetical protein